MPELRRLKLKPRTERGFAGFGNVFMFELKRVARGGGKQAVINRLAKEGLIVESNTPKQLIVSDRKSMHQKRLFWKTLGL